MYDYLQPVDDGLVLRPSGPWASDKLYYLDRYIRVFGRAMRRKWTARNYIDLMAGPGKDRISTTGKILLGSPLIALSASPAFTGFYFADLSPANMASLETRFSASPQSGSVRAMVGDCNQLVTQVVTELKRDKRSLNLAFLDPEGLEFHWSTLEALASVQRVDLIINYPEGGLNRVMKNVYDSPGVTDVDRFFGGPEWRRIYVECRVLGHRPLHRTLINLIKHKLIALGYQDIRNPTEPLIRNAVRNAPLYRLLFVSKHPLGEALWQDINRIDAHGQRRLLEAPR
jgi:three-Cys-motif partner protein